MMLVLSRRKGESVVIGDMIEVRVTHICGDDVRLGITAPPEVPVYRREAWDALSYEGRPTSQPTERLVGRGLVPRGSLSLLTRKMHESIVINDNISIVVVEIRSDKAILGIESPREVPPHRREVFEALKLEEQSKDHE